MLDGLPLEEAVMSRRSVSYSLGSTTYILYGLYELGHVLKLFAYREYESDCRVSCAHAVHTYLKLERIVVMSALTTSG